MKPIDITEIVQEDAQNVLDLIPEKLMRGSASMKSFAKDPTLLTLFAENLRPVNFNFLEKFEKKI